MSTVFGNICSDIASLLMSEPYSEFLGFAIFGCICGVLIKWFKFK